jgi:hypothetical protein
MIATSLAGTATGKTASSAQPEMAAREIEHENVLRFFDDTRSSRIDDNRRGEITVIHPHTHQADLTGHLLEQGGWTDLSLPAKFERTIEFPRASAELIPPTLDRPPRNSACSKFEPPKEKP